MKVYQSKISYGLLTVLFVAFLGPLIFAWIGGQLFGKMSWVSLCLILVFAFVLHTFLKTTYTISNGKLIVKCGLISRKPINIHDIKEISKTKSILSSPAPSFDRIEITYGKFDAIILSPKNKVQFAKDLVSINPDIKNNLPESY